MGLVGQQNPVGPRCSVILVCPATAMVIVLVAAVALVGLFAYQGSITPHNTRDPRSACAHPDNVAKGCGPPKHVLVEGSKRCSSSGDDFLLLSLYIYI